MPSFFSSLRIKHQLFIVQMSSLLIITIIAAIVFWINYIWIANLVSEILLNIQENLAYDSLDIQSALLSTQIKQEYQFRLSNLISASQLYYYVQLQRSNLNLSDLLIIPPPIAIEHQNLSYHNFPYYFSAQYNQIDAREIPQDQESKYIVNFAKTLNYILYAFPNSISKNVLFYTSVLDHQMYGANPGNKFTPSYRSHERTWYKQHFKYIEEHPENSYSLSDPFFVYSTKKISISMTTSLKNINGSILGLYGTDFSLFKLDLFQAFQFINIILVDLNGKIINTKLDQSIWNLKIYISDDNYIYQSEIIGFNDEDWKEIQFQTYYNNGTSNCQSLNSHLIQHQQQHLCRINTRLQSNIYISSYLLDNKYFYITLISVDFLKETKAQIENIFNNITFSVIKIMVICVAIGISIIILCQLYMYFFIQPFETINQLLKFKLLPNSRYENSQITTNQSIFSKIGIEKFYQKILNSGKHKSTECKIQESFKYPKNIIQNESILFKDSDEFFAKLTNFNNQNIKNNLVYLKIIKKSLRV